MSKTKQSVEKPILSQLASLNTPSQVLAKPTLSQLQKPNLMAQLAKINIGNINPSKSRPTLSELAKVNLHSRKSSEINQIVSNPKEYSFADQNDAPVMNLTSALRSNNIAHKERKNPSLQILAKKKHLIPLLYESVSADLSTVVQAPSSFGRVISKVAPTSQSVFFKFSRKMETCSNSEVLLFDFSSQSPDDLIKSRLRIA